MPSARTILKAVLLVGTLDIAAALIHFYIKTGKAPFKPVLTFVASGLLGKTAFTNGDGMMPAGLLIHYCIAAAVTVFFFLTVAQTQLAKEQKMLTGILYGTFVWAVMNLLILPLTKAPKLPIEFWSIVIGMLILICCVGLPLSYISTAGQKKESIESSH
jgi:uncharacterized membrane protein YagU involved in acid resistance